MLINEKDEEETVNDEEITTEEELKRRLIEYNQYKELTNSFKILENKRQEVYTKVPESLNEFRENIKLNTDTTLDDLLNAFEEFLKRQKYLKPLDTKVTEKELSVTKRSKEIKSILKKKKKMNFFELFEVVNKPYVVVTFLSILEMAKNNEISINQGKNFDNILIEMK